MPSIRHHLRIAHSHLAAARAHLESAFEHTVEQHYDSNWTAAIDRAIAEASDTACHVNNVTTMIMPPAIDRAVSQTSLHNLAATWPMQTVMDRLMAALTEIDNVIRRQRRAMATLAALSNMSDLQAARQHIRAAQRVLVTIEGDALPAKASPMQSETPAQPPGLRQP